MKTYPVTLVQVGLLSGTRSVASAGLALALASHVPRDKRGPIGWSLLAAGSVAFIGLVVDLVQRNREPRD
jgi:hypothetical protein